MDFGPDDRAKSTFFLLTRGQPGLLAESHSTGLRGLAWDQKFEIGGGGYFERSQIRIAL